MNVALHKVVHTSLCAHKLNLAQYPVLTGHPGERRLYSILQLR